MKAIYTRIYGVKIFSDDCELWWTLGHKVYLPCAYTLEEIIRKIKEIKEEENEGNNYK